jgi:FHA domain
MTLDHILDKLKQWKRPWAAGSEPVEIHRAVLEDIEAQVVAVGGGRRIFPFDRVEVRLLAPAPGEKERMQAVVQEGWDLEREAVERLRARSVRVPAGFAVKVEVTADPAPEFGGRRYALAFHSTGTRGEAAPVPDARPPAASPAPPGAAGPASQAAGGESRQESVDAAPDGDMAYATAVTEVMPAPAAGGAMPAAAAAPLAAAPTPSPAPSPAPRAARGPQAPPAIGLAVLKGNASRDRFDLRAERIYLGRLAEVVDAAGRVVRRNDVAFAEEGDLNQTVSREHARIAWDPDSRGYWLRDEGSAAGTLIFRSGRSIEVSRHDRRGVRLQDGDEVFLGRAVLRVDLQAG